MIFEIPQKESPKKPPTKKDPILREANPDSLSKRQEQPASRFFAPNSSEEHNKGLATGQIKRYLERFPLIQDTTKNNKDAAESSNKEDLDRQFKDINEMLNDWKRIYGKEFKFRDEDARIYISRHINDFKRKRIIEDQTNAKSYLRKWVEGLKPGDNEDIIDRLGQAVKQKKHLSLYVLTPSYYIAGFDIPKKTAQEKKIAYFVSREDIFSDNNETGFNFEANTISLDENCLLILNPLGRPNSVGIVYNLQKDMIQSLKDTKKDYESDLKFLDTIIPPNSQ